MSLTPDRNDDQRRARIVSVLADAFADLMTADPDAFRVKFRKMAADPFAFYRGSASLFYADIAGGDWSDDRWVDEQTSRVWIQGDLHAENFGTYMDGEGVLIFDVNDFDEAYIGHYTWDLRRLAASIALMGWTKALPDQVISDLIRGYARAYVDQVRHYVASDRDHEWSLRLDTARGAVLAALLAARESSRLDLLDSMTHVADDERAFRRGRGVRRLPDAERGAVLAAFAEYVQSIPEGKRAATTAYQVKDVVGRSGFGIGSAGLPAYQILVEGQTQALENDVVLSIKQSRPAAPAAVVTDPRVQQYFQHAGHRTAISQRALQAHADPWLGWTQLDGVGFVVSELSPYVRDLDWDDLAEPADMVPVLDQIGRATAKVHCVSDEDSDQTLVAFQTEDAISAVIGDDADDFVADLVRFGLEYGERARHDHRLFVEAFRNDEVPGVSAHL